MTLTVLRAAVAAFVAVPTICSAQTVDSATSTVGNTASPSASVPPDKAADEAAPPENAAAPANSNPGAGDIGQPVAATASIVPAGTVISIQVDTDVNSKTFVTGQTFSISLIEPVMLGDAVAIPAGTKGQGQVVHAAKSGWGGKPGELILAARYLDLNGRQIPLRGMKLGSTGKDNHVAAFAAGQLLTPAIFVINGKNANVATGMPATAKLAADFVPADAEAPTASVPSTTAANAAQTAPDAASTAASDANPATTVPTP